MDVQTQQQSDQMETKRRCAEAGVLGLPVPLLAESLQLDELAGELGASLAAAQPELKGA
jgi:hypothetical protein